MIRIVLLSIVLFVTTLGCSGQTVFKGELLGHSSLDGSDGKIDPDISQLTTALDIVKGNTVYIDN